MADAEAGPLLPSARIIPAWSAWAATAAIPNAVTHATATTTCGEHITRMAATTRAAIAATTITAIDTMAMCPATIILPDFMAGVGADLRGMDIPDTTSRRMRFIPARLSG